MRWTVKFFIMREEYGDEEKEYIIRKNMKLSQGQWDVSFPTTYKNSLLIVIETT